MKALLQRVTHASVMVENRIVGEIANGLLIFLGITADDTADECEMLAEKICKLRIFADENDKTNCAINDIGGGLLIVSQFNFAPIAARERVQVFPMPLPPIQQGNCTSCSLICADSVLRKSGWANLARICRLIYVMTAHSPSG